MNTLAHIASDTIIYRQAQMSDKQALLHIENTCFANDRLSARQMVYWLKAKHKVLLLAQQGSEVIAYGLAIMRKGTSLARLYSLGVLPTARGLGVAKALITQLEEACVAKNKLFLRLEVSTTNHNAIALYRSMGYRDFGFYSAYYEDNSDALRMQKPILQSALLDMANNSVADAKQNKHKTTKSDVSAKNMRAYPYFQQTTDFTCGPAALLMAMANQDETVELSQQAELDIWRSATTIFMTSGHGGTHPLGLALAAETYGFKPQVFINQPIPLFLASVRSEQKKSILAFVEHGFLQQAKQKNIELRYEEFNVSHIKEALISGDSVLCLISSYQFDGFKGPHWVSVTHIDDDFLYIHDPEPTEHVIERQHVPVSLDKFERYTRYGKARLRTAIILRK